MRAAAPRRFRAGEAALTGLLHEALPAWRRRMTAAGASALLREAGHIVAWESAATAAKGRQASLALRSEDYRCRDLDASEAAALERAAPGRVSGAVRYEGTASVTDPVAVLAALRAAFVAGGGSVETGAAGPDRLSRGEAEIVVVTAGVRSAALMAGLGYRVPMIAERGYHVQAPAAGWPNALPPVVFEDRSVVANGFTSGLRMTSFVEFTTPDAPPDARKWARLEAHAAALGVAFDRAPDRGSAAGRRCRTICPRSAAVGAHRPCSTPSAISISA